MKTYWLINTDRKVVGGFTEDDADYMRYPRAQRLKVGGELTEKFGEYEKVTLRRIK